jgi:cobalt-zinc-cadmium efflux system outer membrane protein
VFQIRKAVAWQTLGLLALLCTSPGLTQAAYSLTEMLAAAVARNPQMAVADAERRVADALRRKAEQPFADSPSANVKYQTDQIGSDLGYREWEGGVDLPLWLPGQPASYAREAAQTLEVSDSVSDSTRLEIAGELRERLWTAAIARGELEQARSARDVADRLLQDVRQRVDAGELPRSDQLLAEKELLQREEVLLEVSNRAAQAERLFTRYTGLEAPAEPAPEQVNTPAGLAPGHPALQLTQRQIDRARAHRDRIGKVRRSGPNLWVGGKTVKAMAGSGYDSAIGIELSLPFGGAAHTAPELAEAEAELTRAQVAHSAAGLALEDALTRASLELDRARSVVQQTERRLALAEESLQLSRRAFDLGETDLVRLLQAQADAFAARDDHEIRQLEHGQAVARLNQALGVIPQ